MIIAKTIDLTSVSPSVERYNRPLFVGDKNALTFQFELQNAGASVTMKAYGIRADGETVLVDATALNQSNSFAVKISAPFTAVPGRLQLVVKALVSDTEIVTVYAADMVVVNTTTDTIVDPSRVVPSLDELLAQIATISAATSAANTAAAKVNKMTIHGSVSDHFEVQSGLNSQGGIDINILGGVGVKGDKGDKGDAGGIQSVNGVEPTEAGELTINASDIPGAMQMDLLCSSGHDFLDERFVIGDYTQYKMLFLVFGANTQCVQMLVPGQEAFSFVFPNSDNTARMYSITGVIEWNISLGILFSSTLRFYKTSATSGNTSTLNPTLSKIYGVK